MKAQTFKWWIFHFQIESDNDIAELTAMIKKAREWDQFHFRSRNEKFHFRSQWKDHFWSSALLDMSTTRSFVLAHPQRIGWIWNAEISLDISWTYLKYFLDRLSNIFSSFSYKITHDISMNTLTIEIDIFSFSESQDIIRQRKKRHSIA